MPPVRINLVGDSKVGKTTLLQAISKDRGPVIFTRDNQEVEVEIYESETPYSDMDGYLVIFDVHRPETLKHAEHILQSLDPSIPKVICGNKVDISNRVIKPGTITLHRDFGCKYYDISTKTSLNLDKPWNELLQRLV